MSCSVILYYTYSLNAVVTLCCVIVIRVRFNTIGSKWMRVVAKKSYVIRATVCSIRFFDLIEKYSDCCYRPFGKIAQGLAHKRGTVLHVNTFESYAHILNVNFK